MLDRLDDAFTTQQRLLRDIGHELRTPLAIASGHLWFVPETEESAEALAVVREEHNRMRRLIEDLLVLARAERRDFLVLETVDLSVLVDGLGERASQLMEAARLLGAPLGRSESVCSSAVRSSSGNPLYCSASSNHRATIACTRSGSSSARFVDCERSTATW